MEKGESHFLFFEGDFNSYSLKDVVYKTDDGYIPINQWSGSQNRTKRLRSIFEGCKNRSVEFRFGDEYYLLEGKASDIFLTSCRVYILHLINGGKVTINKKVVNSKSYNIVSLTQIMTLLSDALEQICRSDICDLLYRSDIDYVRFRKSELMWFLYIYTYNYCSGLEEERYDAIYDYDTGMFKDDQYVCSGKEFKLKCHICMGKGSFISYVSNEVDSDFNSLFRFRTIEEETFAKPIWCKGHNDELKVNVDGKDGYKIIYLHHEMKGDHAHWRMFNLTKFLTFTVLDELNLSSIGLYILSFITRIMHNFRNSRGIRSSIKHSIMNPINSFFMSCLVSGCSDDKYVLFSFLDLCLQVEKGGFEYFVPDQQVHYDEYISFLVEFIKKSKEYHMCNIVLVEKINHFMKYYSSISKLKYFQANNNFNLKQNFKSVEEQKRDFMFCKCNSCWDHNVLFAEKLKVLCKCEVCDIDFKCDLFEKTGVCWCLSCIRKVNG